MNPPSAPGPHHGLPILTAGDPAASRGAMVLLHGRGDTADGILTLADVLDRPGWLYIAPQAAAGTWYPQRFMVPQAHNEPWLSSALLRVDEALAVAERAGVPRERALLMGFSQGACLALEAAARAGGRLGSLAALSGGLIGDRLEPERYRDLGGTPTFMGCSDVDPHIPLERVEGSARLLADLGAIVDLRVYPDLGHTVNEDEIEALGAMMAHLERPR